MNFGRPNPADYDPSKFGKARGPAGFKPGKEVKASGLSLNTGWNRKPAGKLKVSNMAQIFAGIEAGYDPKPDPDRVLYKGVTYLMPLDQAVAALSLGRPGSRKTLSTACMPFNSLYHRSWKGNFDGWSEISLVTDSKNNVVMVMLIQQSPRSRMFNISQYRTDWNLLNIVYDRAKAQRSWGIHHEREMEGGNYVLTSDLIDDRAKSREQLKVIIPPQMAKIVAGLVKLSGK